MLISSGHRVKISPRASRRQVSSMRAFRALSGLIGWIMTAGQTGWLKHTSLKGGRPQFTQDIGVFLGAHVCAVVSACKLENLTSKNCQNITTVRKLALRCLCCVRSQLLAMATSKYPAGEDRRTATCF